MPDAADYPELCDRPQDQAGGDGGSREDAQSMPATAEVQGGGSVPDCVAQGTGATGTRGSSSSSSSSSSSDDDDDDDDGALKRGTLGGGGSGPPKPKPPSRQLTAIEANTVALELRVMLSTCWRAAIPLPPAPGHSSSAESEYWRRANQLVARAWRISPPSSRKMLAEVSPARFCEFAACLPVASSHISLTQHSCCLMTSHPLVTFEGCRCDRALCRRYLVAQTALSAATARKQAGAKQPGGWRPGFTCPCPNDCCVEAARAFTGSVIWVVSWPRTGRHRRRIDYAGQLHA